jgi:hypothetical protein
MWMPPPKQARIERFSSRIGSGFNREAAFNRSRRGGSKRRAGVERMRSFTPPIWTGRSVVVIGGGASDAVGFAAAIAHRGEARQVTDFDAGPGDPASASRWRQLVPKKNGWVVFRPWQQSTTRNCATLSDRDFVCGFSEAVKVRC